MLHEYLEWNLLDLENQRVTYQVLSVAEKQVLEAILAESVKIPLRRGLGGDLGRKCFASREAKIRIPDRIVRELEDLGNASWDGDGL